MKGLTLQNHKALSGAVLALALSLTIGCSKGARGKQGPAGPVGPIVGAAQITSVFPSTLTAATNFRIHGEGFVGTSGEMVLVNGYPVTILSSTPTEIWATGASYTNGLYEGDVTVQVDGRNSNSFPVYFGHPGDAVAAPVVGPGQFGGSVLDTSGQAVYLGDLYGYEINADGGSTSSGLIWKYEFDKNRVSEVYADQDVTYISALAWGPDGKLYMGAEDYQSETARLYRFGTAFDASTKSVLLSDATCSDITAMAWAPNGDLWVGDSDGCVSVRTAAGQFYYDNAGTGYPVVGIFQNQGRMTVVDTSYVTWYDATDTSAPVQVNQAYQGYYEVAAAESDGTNVYVLMDNGYDGIRKVTSSGSSQTIVPASPATGDSSFVSPGSGSSFLHQDASGAWYLSAGDSSATIGRLEKSGTFTHEWVTPMDNWYYALEVGGSLFTVFDYDCAAGIGSPVMRQTLDGEISPIALDVCGDADLADANGLLYVADPRGYILQIDPNEGSQTVVTSDPALQVPLAFATDGSSFFVATANTAGTYDIVKLGSNGSTVDRGFVTDLPDSPTDMVVSGSTLTWVDRYSAHQISAEGGAITTTIPKSLGFQYLYWVGEAADGSPLYSDYYGMYSVSSTGDVRIVSPDLTVYDPRPDAFGGISGGGSNDAYSLTSVLP